MLRHEPGPSRFGGRVFSLLDCSMPPEETPADTTPETPPAAPPKPAPARPPVVAIVGRPNVGKSSLLNALAGRRISIVQDEPGVTRDRVSTAVQIDGRWIELVDTGGYGFVDPDELTDHIRRQVEQAWNKADLVLFIVDAQTGPNAADEEIAGLLRKHGGKVALIANKADGEKIDLNLGDFARLGLGTPLGVSATTKRNLDALPDLIRRNVDLKNAPTEQPPPEMLIAIVGKRNAGKSTFVNAVAETFEGDKDRVIVSEVPGTTRDSIDVKFTKDGQSLVVIDTAGVRKKRHMVTNDIEFYSYHRAQRSIRRADVVMLLIDATEKISDPDKKLARYVADELKPVMIVMNKWDLALEKLREQRANEKEPTDDRTLMEEYRSYVDRELPFLDFAPIAFITASSGRNVPVVLDLAKRLFKQARERVTTGKLNAAIKQILQERTPSAPAGRRPKIFYATQASVAPPTIVLFVNDPINLDESYRRFIINRFRELLPYAEVPVQLIVRARTQRAKGEPGADELNPTQTGLRKAAPKRKMVNPLLNKRQGTFGPPRKGGSQVQGRHQTARVGKKSPGR